ncbi:hypothetical protein [Prevotella bivia]|uniref:hypothetical protein n=1 Tax=Prevotella bivia TaxID=28125 RepID=UPI00288BF46E|nr:hypothetical protein [Prevotella bivia]
MEKYLTVCGIGNGSGIIADSIYQKYAVSDENAWQNSGIDIMSIGNAWDLKELSVINKVKGKATQVSFSRITVFIACLGGDTMPALLPYYIEMARQQKSRVLVCFTLPFAVEGRERMQKAYHDFELLRNAADGYILVEFNALQLNSSGIVEAFREADNYVIETLADMYHTVFYPSLLCFDLNDFCMVMLRQKGRIIPFVKRYSLPEAATINEIKEATQKFIRDTQSLVTLLRERIYGIVLDIVAYIDDERGKAIVESVDTLFQQTFADDCDIKWTMHSADESTREICFKLYVKIKD